MTEIVLKGSFRVTVEPAGGAAPCGGHAHKARSGVILVLGATGNNGGATARALASRGVHFRAAARNPAKAHGLDKKYAEMVEVDYKRPVTLAKAMQGVEKLFMVQAGAMGGEDQVEEGKRIVDAAAAAGVRHIVKLSALGAQHPRLFAFGAEHAEVESYIKSKGIALTSLRPSYFYANFLSMDAASIKGQGAFYNVIPPHARVNFVSVEENGEAAAAVLTTAGHEGMEYYLTGPDTISMADVAATFTRVLGRPINHVQIPFDALRATLGTYGLPPPVIDGVANMFTYFNDGRYDFHARDLELLTGHRGQSLEEFVRSNIAAFSADTGAPSAGLRVAPVDHRPLGRQGLVCSGQGLGCMGMTSFYTADPAAVEDQSLATIARALELGVNMFNTAHIYMHLSGATNEGLLGKAIRQHGREKFVIGTKLGIRVENGQFNVDCSPKAVRELTEVSLQRLGTDYIDIFIQNRLDPKVPIEETMAAIKELVAEGKVKYVGMSEVSAEMLRRAHAVQPISCIEMEYSIWTRSIEEEVLPAARELGIAVLAYSPMGRGMLTGKLSKETLGEKDFRRHLPRFEGEAFEKNLEGVKKIEAIAKRKGCTTGQLALAWVHAQGEDIFPIPGTKNPKYLDENVAAFHLSKTLTKDDLREIEAAFPPESVVGARYSAAHAALLHENQKK